MKLVLAPILQIDTREQTPLVLSRFPSERATLSVGDYGIRGFSDWANPQFIIERKSLDDLVGSLCQGRNRFWAEVEKMRQFQFRGLVVEGVRDQVLMGQYRSQASPQSILASLDALAVRFNLHCFWCGDSEGAARQVESLVWQFVRGLAKSIGLMLPSDVRVEVADLSAPTPGGQGPLTVAPDGRGALAGARADH